MQHCRKIIFIGYEYRDITVKKIMQSVYADNFGSFGWTRVAPYLIFRSISAKRTEAADPLIGQKYDELYSV